MATATCENRGQLVSEHAQDGQEWLGPSWHAREFRPDDADRICSWVQSQAVLQLVSSDKGEQLTHGILTSWLDLAIGTIVIASDATDAPVGFCTLSTAEIPAAPTGFIELCHLVVDPRHRYLFIGPRIASAAKGLARQLSYCTLHGRVVPHHRYGLALARRQTFVEIDMLPEFLPVGFRWFCCDLTHGEGSIWNKVVS